MKIWPVAVQLIGDSQKQLFRQLLVVNDSRDSAFLKSKTTSDSYHTVHDETFAQLSAVIKLIIQVLHSKPNHKQVTYIIRVHTFMC